MNSQVRLAQYRSAAIDAANPPDDHSGRYSFGRFVARPTSRDLLLDGEPICIGSRAFDLLIALLRSAGEIVTKESIFRHVWPSTTVDESNLRFQMASLRKTLGSERDRIKTIPGRGYLFIADEAAAIPMIGAAMPVGGERANRCAIVIIDEDRENREALQRLLRPLQALVQSFGSFEAFLANGLSLQD